MESELETHFGKMDYVDIKRIESHANLRRFIAGMLSYYPWWIVLLYRFREVLVRILGLVRHEKPDDLPSLGPEDISFAPGDTASFFTVRKAEEDAYWIAETPEDKHLTAFLAVKTRRLDSGKSRFEVVTAIQYRHWTGPIYFNLIRPFHHLVLCRMMKSGATHTN